MSDSLNIAILGADGRMGGAVRGALADIDAAVFCAGIVPQGSAYLQQPLYTADLRSALNSCDVLIDFSAPKAAIDAALMMHDVRCRAMVSGTTGFAPAEMAAFDTAAQSVAMVQTGNFSLGVNVLSALVEKAARILGPEWDIDILDVHHRHKVDAPSGTALMLGEAAAKGRDHDLPRVISTERNGPRAAGEIGFSALRMGGVIGAHDVNFASPSESLTLSHRAIDRSLFARGAVRAAIWAAEQKPGRFDMADVLGLNAL